ncbi:MAG: 3-phosphoserine/phosphohydroxythreonine transaminase [Phycisphaerales bacterium]|nr:3-phosphoserine/phosphohydroxythreonine transaminase [Phycisphaerales bacterium]
MTPTTASALTSQAAARGSGSTRVYNFGAGPSTLPEEMIRQIQSDIYDYAGTGMGILELSHRGKEYDAIVAEIDRDVRSVGNIPADYDVLFMTGGATSQNYIVPANLLPEGATADHIVTGHWAQGSFDDAKQYTSCHNSGATVHSAYHGGGDKFAHLPADSEICYSKSPAYVHMTSNNTLYGTQWLDAQGRTRLPNVPAGAFLVSDGCSDFFWDEMDVSKFGLIYGGAQKNMGTAGTTFVIVRKDLVARASKAIPRMLQYGLFSKEESRPNTPPMFAIYTVGLMVKWVRSQGGLKAMGQRNRMKAGLIYDALDRHAGTGGFYLPHAAKADRSMMNITFKCAAGPAMDDAFVAGAREHGMDVLKGHRMTGGMRASTYNAMPVEGCRALAEFIDDFARRKG